MCGGALLAVLTGCSMGSPDVTATVTVEATPSPSPEADPVDCTAEQLSGSFEKNPIINIEIRNVSNTACIIRGGYPSVAAVDLNDAPVLPEAAQDDSWEVGVQDVTVAPGASAFAVFSFGDQRQVANSSPVEIGGFSVTLPESETVVFIPYASSIWVSPDTDNSLIVRPISAEREDTTIA